MHVLRVVHHSALFALNGAFCGWPGHVHHSALPFRWSSVVHGLKSKLPFIPGLKLFAILRPLPNIKRVFRRWALRALQQPIGS